MVWFQNINRVQAYTKSMVFMVSPMLWTHFQSAFQLHEPSSEFFGLYFQRQNPLSSAYKLALCGGGGRGGVLNDSIWYRDIYA